MKTSTGITHNSFRLLCVDEKEVFTVPLDTENFCKYVEAGYSYREHFYSESHKVTYWVMVRN